MDLRTFGIKSSGKSAANKKYLAQLKKMNPRAVDKAFHTVHQEVFEEIDCLACANCCKTTSPIFYAGDIARASRALRMRPAQFIERYLKVDEDNDYVLQSSPCAFLDADNHCTIYEDRPRACREYPHTDRKKMVQIMNLTYKNTLVCPAVFEMVERLQNTKW